MSHQGKGASGDGGGGAITFPWKVVLIVCPLTMFHYLGTVPASVVLNGRQCVCEDTLPRCLVMVLV